MEKPETYEYWLKASAMMVVPQLSDYRELFYVGIEFIGEIWHTLVILTLRLLILITFPISVPVIAWILLRYNIKAIRDRAAVKKRLMDQLQNISSKETHSG